MPDENTTASPASNVSGLPPESVDAISPSVTETKDVETSPLAEAKRKAHHAAPKTTPHKAQPASEHPVKHQDLRIEPRMRVRWHADALVDGQVMYRGFVKDISLKGTDIFLDVNLQKIKSIKVRLHVPPLSKKSEPHVMEVSAKVVYTAYDSNEFLFHTGVKFLQFESESDQAFLQSRIASFNHAR